jgi:uncharacterized protein YndB with AHSA1/START domain
MTAPATMQVETKANDFILTRIFDAPREFVFKARTDPAAKARWFRGPDEWKQTIRELDFRVGGRERLRGTWPDGRVSAFDALYQDIVPDQRIVYTYDMHINEKSRWTRGRAVPGAGGAITGGIANLTCGSLVDQRCP